MTDEKRMQTSLYTGYSNTWEYSGISDIESGAESQQRNRHARTIVGTTGSLSDGTVWSMLIEEERSLHQIWHHVRKINEQAYAAALVDLELVVGHYINSPLDVAAAIRFIESARFFFGHYERTPFQQPDCKSLREWRAIHERADFVFDVREQPLSMTLSDDGQALIEMIGRRPFWFRVCDEVVSAVARSALVLNPIMGRHPSEQEIEDVVDRLIIALGFQHEFRPRISEISAYLQDKKLPSGG